MTRTTKLFAVALILTLALCLMPQLASAQNINSTVASVAVSATVGESLTVTCDLASVTLSTTPTTSFHCTTTWALDPTVHKNLNTAIFFNSGTALTGTKTGSQVATSAVQCSINGTQGSPSTFTATQVLNGQTIANTCAGDISLNITSANANGGFTEAVGAWIPGLGGYPVDSYSGVINAEVFAF